MVYLVSMGMGNRALLTGQALDAVAKSVCLIGAQRLLDCFPESGAEKVAASAPVAMAREIHARPGVDISVLLSGDCGFYSAAKGLARPLENCEVQYIPGISSLQYFCSRLGASWDDVKVLSLHGRDGDLLGAVERNHRTFVLTGGENGVTNICGWLAESGYGELLVQVGERLSYPEEKITRGEARVLRRQQFDPLAVMLIQNGSARGGKLPVTHGLPDERFLRGDAPMTKSEVRAVSIAKMQLRPNQTVWDVGAGTGSVSVEVARVLLGGVVYAVEKEEAALGLLEQNRMRFGLRNLKVIKGLAPFVLKELPAPDAVFVGGSSGGISPILRIALDKNPNVRIVVNAITLETVGAVLDCFNEYQVESPEIAQVAVAKAKIVGGNHMMMGQNPIYILSAGGGDVRGL